MRSSNVSPYKTIHAVEGALESALALELTARRGAHGFAPAIEAADARVDDDGSQVQRVCAAATSREGVRVAETRKRAEE